jgi:DNA polymerase III gamma/tau subunit
MTTEWINKYRPETFEQVYGNKSVVKSLKAAIEKGAARSFLLTGQSGVGKTTLARIAAKAAGAIAYGDIQEIDGATNTGIDAMRAVLDALSYRPVGLSKAKAVIVDEAHALSKPAITALLKSLEEPPDWLYWFLCTTEENRIPANVRTRLFRADLKAIRQNDLVALLDHVCEQEKLSTPERVVDACAASASGSARQAISNLAMCAAARSTKEVDTILKTASEKAEAVELARALMFGNWTTAQSLLGRLGDTSPESVRYIVRAYVSKVVRGAKREAVAGRGCEVLDAFSQPFYDNAALDLAVGRILLS